MHRRLFFGFGHQCQWSNLYILSLHNQGKVRFTSLAAAATCTAAARLFVIFSTCNNCARPRHTTLAQRAKHNNSLFLNMRGFHRWCVGGNILNGYIFVIFCWVTYLTLAFPVFSRLRRLKRVFGRSSRNANHVCFLLFLLLHLLGRSIGINELYFSPSLGLFI